MDQKTPYGKNIFVFITIAFCLVVATIMGFDQKLTTKVAEIVADGLISLSLFVAVSFLASHSLDYSGVLTKVGNRFGGQAKAAIEFVSVDPIDGSVSTPPNASNDAKG